MSRESWGLSRRGWTAVAVLSLLLLYGDYLAAADLTGDLLGGVGQPVRPPRFETLWEEGASFEGRVRYRFFYLDFFVSGQVSNLGSNREGLRSILGISSLPGVSASGGDLEIFSAGAGIVLNLRKSRLVNPYLKFGVNRYWYSSSEATVSGPDEERVEELNRQTAHFGGGFGIGLELQAYEKCSFILEGGRHIADLETSGEMLHLMVFTAGVNFRGGR